MKSWPSVQIPTLPADGTAPTVPRTIRVHDTARRDVVDLALGPRVGMYVCGITPYDATHMGHAATYVTFDLLGRVLRDAGHEVTYVQNVTDVDDPLLERARRDGLAWQDLATREIDLFREDMTALRVMPPDHYLGVVEEMATIEAAVVELVDAGATYGIAAEAGHDLYLDLTQRPDLGRVSGWTREQMLAVFAERGGDPDRAGKRDALDPLLWRAARPGEPSWPSERLGAGRPGWHIECTAIARERLGIPFEIQGGGDDLIFPHHEMSAVQATTLCRCPVFAQAYVHQAMVGLNGAKMSKSKGNLVLVSKLREQGEDPMVIRLVLLAQHYRNGWDWRDELVETARDRLARWRAACIRATGPEDAPDARPVLATMRARLRDDLDAPGVLAAVDDWAQAALARPGLAQPDRRTDVPTHGAGTLDAGAPLLGLAVDTLLGVRL